MCGRGTKRHGLVMGLSSGWWLNLKAKKGLFQPRPFYYFNFVCHQFFHLSFPKGQIFCYVALYEPTHAKRFRFPLLCSTQSLIDDACRKAPDLNPGEKICHASIFLPSGRDFHWSRVMYVTYNQVRRPIFCLYRDLRHGAHPIALQTISV